MNKELFVSSTPHETKVGLVEDDLLAEIYLERENEYTLAGSIYKGRVTRVLPGMQSAFVDIGLERDAFLYVSDFMELEEHDEDVTDVVPAGRGVQDMRSQPAADEGGGAPSATQSEEGTEAGESATTFEGESSGHSARAEEPGGSQPSIGAVSPEASGGRDSQERERGGWRGRRRRRGGRRDGRDRDRTMEPRLATAATESLPAPAIPRQQESGRGQQFGPPAGYQPIILPGESISKYRGMASAPVATQSRAVEDQALESAAETEEPIAATFPDDEPIFASPAAAAQSQIEEHEDEQPREERRAEAAATSVDWNREFYRRDSGITGAAAAPAKGTEATREVAEEGYETVAAPEHASAPASESVPAFAHPGTLEEETIDEEEADTVRYEQASDEGYDEFEEVTRAAGQTGLETAPSEFSEVRDTVDEIHMTSLAESGAAPAETAAAESEEDSEEMELEEAQAQAEALLDAEARGSGAVDARAEVRAPAGTAGYTQRAPRPRPGYERRSGGRRGGGRRFPRRESHEVPKISDLLKEGQEILVQIAKEPIGKKGARITSHIALPGRFLVYMPTVNHTGVSRKIASDEERQRLKRIVM
ncbi:MAG: ribonuclease E/G, partial [Candidatus Sulfotelmatobacter sp.]